MSERGMSERLCKQFDQLNALWGEAEKQLAALHTPVECWHVFDTFKDGEVRIERMLGWVKYHHGWRLCLGTNVIEADDQWWRPVSECSAGDRVGAIGAFAPLKVKLLGKTAEFAVTVDAAIEQLRKQVEI